MGEATFERVEMKYLITVRQEEELLQAIREKILPDPYGNSTIRNLYCDTPDFLLARRSMEGGPYKEKCRIRSYAEVKPLDPVFLELKKKYHGVTYKRRILVQDAQAEGYMNGTAELGDDSQIGKEIRWFRNVYPALRPVKAVFYDRKGYFAKEDDGLRITFDTNVRYRDDRLSLQEEPDGKVILDPGWAVMEVKASFGLPLWLVKQLSGRKIRQTGFSKYELSVLDEQCSRKEEKRRESCWIRSLQPMSGTSPLRAF